MSFNLQRDAKVYVSSVITGFTPANTFEVRVMSGFNFNQTTETTDISVDEAGAAPARGQKRFNTKLNPSDLKFSTYIRPYQEGGVHDCPERILWEGLVGDGTLGTNAVASPTGVEITLDGSNVHELGKLFLFVDYGNIKYRIEEVVMAQVRIGFDIQAIAMLEWTANGKIIKEVETINALTFPSGTDFKPVPDCADFIKNKLSTLALQGQFDKTQASQVIDFTGSTLFAASTPLGIAAGNYTFTVECDGGLPVTYTFTATGTDTVEDLAEFLGAQLCCANVSIDFTAKTITIKTKTYGSDSSILLTDGTLFAAIGATVNFVVSVGAPVAGTTANRVYNIPLTGGEIIINNNVTFLTPDELGVVNVPIGHFTGVRSITGNLTAYLRSGSNNDAARLITDMYHSIKDTTAEFVCTIDIGGATNTPRVSLAMPKAHLSIPTIDTQDVISTSIDFMAVPTDLEDTDELVVTYIAGTPSASLLVSP